MKDVGRIREGGVTAIRAQYMQVRNCQRTNLIKVVFKEYKIPLLLSSLVTLKKPLSSSTTSWVSGFSRWQVIKSVLFESLCPIWDSSKHVFQQEHSLCTLSQDHCLS